MYMHRKCERDRESERKRVGQREKDREGEVNI